ncbi:MAG: glucokinase [Gammaproteobacteria bacterium]|nr:glucokinase [Gammaproteobacteria bacterium]
MAWLVADVGGTWSRCGLAADGALIGTPAVFPNAEFPGLAELLESYLSGLPPATRPRHAALGIAGPVGSDEIRMLNRGWSLSLRALGAGLAMDVIAAINDFEAVAWSLPALRPQALAAVGNGSAIAGAPCVAIGPGTGLGVAALVQQGRVVVGGEGGHVTLPAQDEAEERIVRLARERYGHCSAERIVSGPGLSFLHEAMHGVPAVTAEEIGRRHEAGDAAAVATIRQFFRFLGTVAGNAALTFCATGGVYIAGGIAPRYVDALRDSGFRERFVAKGRYREYLEAVPTWVVTAGDPALTGLARYAASREVVG